MTDPGCSLCGLRGTHAHQPHLFLSSNADGSGRRRITRCLACTEPRHPANAEALCPALLRVERWT